MLTNLKHYNLFDYLISRETNYDQILIYSGLNNIRPRL